MFAMIKHTSYTKSSRLGQNELNLVIILKYDMDLKLKHLKLSFQNKMFKTA